MLSLEINLYCRHVGDHLFEVASGGLLNLGSTWLLHAILFDIKQLVGNGESL